MSLLKLYKLAGRAHPVSQSAQRIAERWMKMVRYEALKMHSMRNLSRCNELLESRSSDPLRASLTSRSCDCNSTRMFESSSTSSHNLVMSRRTMLSHCRVWLC